MKKKVVLCIPIYNAAQTLEQTLESLLAQDYPIFKLKLFDNASTDGTRAIIDRYLKQHFHLEVHTNEVLVSAEDNFTNCIQAAEGDYTAIVHSDDVYEPNFISSAVRAFEQNEHCVAVFCHAREIDLQGNVIGERFLPPFLKKQELTFMSFRELLQHTLNFANFLTCPSAVVKSEVYREVVQTWKGEEFKSSADLDTWLRISRAGLICFNSSPLINYRVANVSYSYRLAKVRLTKHEIFLVLEPYLRDNLNWLPEESLNDYKFLHFKDEAFRIINAWKNKAPRGQLGEIQKVDWLVVLPRIFRSKWHFKIGLGIIGSRFLLGLL